MPDSHISNMGIIFTQIFSNFIVFSLNVLRYLTIGFNCLNCEANSHALVDVSPKEKVVG